jgi:hypothetical protein
MYYYYYYIIIIITLNVAPCPLRIRAVSGAARHPSGARPRKSIIITVIKMNNNHTRVNDYYHYHRRLV